MYKKETLGTPMVVLAVFLLLLLARLLPAEQIGMDENPYLAAVVLQLLIYCIPSLFYCRLRGRSFSSHLRLRLPSPGSILYLLYGTVFLIGVSSLLSVAMYLWMPELFSAGSSGTVTAFAQNRGLFDGVYLVLAFAILPAMTEEVLFRGIVLASYETMGLPTAVWMSALTFAMSHFNFARFPVYLASGLILTGITYTTRSLPAAVLVHGLHNAFVLFLEPYILHVAEKRSISMVLFLILTAALTLAAALLSCAEASGIYRGYAVKNVPSPYYTRSKHTIARLAQAVFSPLFLIVVILFVVVSYTMT